MNNEPTALDIDEELVWTNPNRRKKCMCEFLHWENAKICSGFIGWSGHACIECGHSFYCHKEIAP